MICGSHGGDYEDGRLLGCGAVQTGMILPTFQRSHRPEDGGSKDPRNVWYEALIATDSNEIFSGRQPC
jgi:hypothetical protein